MPELSSELDHPADLREIDTALGDTEPLELTLPAGPQALDNGARLLSDSPDDAGFGETAGTTDVDDDHERTQTISGSRSIPPGPPEDIPSSVEELGFDIGDLDLEGDDEEAFEPDDIGEGEGGDRDGIEAIDAEWESGLRARFADFAPAREQLETELAAVPNPHDHPDFIGQGGDEEAPGFSAYRIGSQEAPDDKAFVTRVSPTDFVQANEELVEDRYRDLVRGHSMPPETRPYVEQIVAHDPVRGSITGYEGRSVHEMTDDEWSTVSDTPEVLGTTLEVLSSMFTTGLNPDVQGDPVSNVTWNEQKQGFVMIDYERLEDDDYESWDPDDPRVAANSAVGDFERFSEALAGACPDEARAAHIRSQSRQLVSDFAMRFGI